MMIEGVASSFGRFCQWDVERRFLRSTPETFDLTAEEFRALLDICHLSQRRFADLIGRSMQIVSLWACGHEAVPRYAAGFLICFARLDPQDQDCIRNAVA